MFERILKCSNVAVLAAIYTLAAGLSAPAMASNAIQKIKPGFYAVYTPPKADGKSWVKYFETPKGIDFLKFKKGAYTGRFSTKHIQTEAVQEWLTEFCDLQDKSPSGFAITKSTAKKVSFGFTCN